MKSGKMRLLDRPVPGQAVAEKRTCSGFEEAAATRFALDLSTELVRGDHAAQTRPSDALRTPIHRARCVVEHRFLGQSSQRKRLFSGQLRHFFRIAEGRGKFGLRILVKRLMRHSPQAGVLRLAPLLLMHSRSTAFAARLHAASVALHYGQCRRCLHRRTRRQVVGCFRVAQFGQFVANSHRDAFDGFRRNFIAAQLLQQHRRAIKRRRLAASVDHPLRQCGHAFPRVQSQGFTLREKKPADSGCNSPWVR